MGSEFNELPMGIAPTAWNAMVKELANRDAEIERLKAERDAAYLAHESSEAVLHMTIARLGGLVEGRPTHRGNFLQRIDALVRMEECNGK